MRRREFVGLVGGAAAWPLAARAQPAERVRRVGILMSYAETDAVNQARVAAFKQRLRALGWIEGRNIRFDERWADIGAGSDRMRTAASELLRLRPEAIITNGPIGVRAVQALGRDVPVVFTAVSDPLAIGLIESLAQPGGNATGFTMFEGSVVGKLVEALKEVAPSVARVGLMVNLDNPASALHVRALQAVAPRLAITPLVTPVFNREDIERAIEAFAREANSAFIVQPESIIATNRELVVALAARHRLPATYVDRSFVQAGGLMSYGVDQTDNYRGVAGYVDRILKGERAGNLPVQQPTKFEFVLNLKTAKAMGLDVPTSILLRADEVIE